MAAAIQSQMSAENGIADRSTMYKWLRGDALPGIDNLLALSVLLNVSVNDIIVTR